MSSPSFRRVSLLAIWLLCLAPASGAAARAQEQETESAFLSEALEKAGAGEWQTLHFVVECQTSEGFHALEVFGSGVGISDLKSQFHLEKTQIQESLQVFRDFAFAAMPERFGGGPGKEGEPPKHAVRVTCRVSLQLNQLGKQVVQLEKGEQSRELKQMASRLLEISREPSQNGVRAEDLNDGLAKLMTGQLAPETFRVLINRKPQESELKRGEPGWILRIDGREISVQAYSPAGAEATIRKAPLEDADVKKLAEVLKDEDLESFPVNLYAGHYTDLTVAVLNRKKNVQARQFAGMTPATHGEKQKAFDRIFQFLDELRRTVER